jgi:four helix bundle protein
MPEISKQGSKPYNLEERTFLFAKRVLDFVKTLPRTIGNSEVIKQVARSAGSVGANYIEANESLSKKDFLMRIKICRKEAKESCYWLRLLSCSSEDEPERGDLVREATEIMKIFGSIVEKTEPKKIEK